MKICPFCEVESAAASPVGAYSLKEALTLGLNIGEVFQGQVQAVVCADHRAELLDHILRLIGRLADDDPKGAA